MATPYIAVCHCKLLYIITYPKENLIFISTWPFAFYCNGLLKMPWKLSFIQNVSAILFVLLWENSWGNFERESNIVNSENKEAFVMFLCYYAGSRENYGHRLDLFGHAQISQGIGFVCSSWSCIKLWHLSLSDFSSILET